MSAVEVMHVPEREDRRAAIEKQAEHFDVCVHTDPDHRGPLPTLIDCLEHAQESGRRVHGDWVLVLQDDAEPFPRTREHLRRALDHAPSPVLGMSNCGDTNRKAAEQGAPYLVQPIALSGAGFAVHGRVLDDLIRFLRPMWEIDGYIHDDTALAMFTRHVGETNARVTYALFDQRLPTSLRTSRSKREGPERTIETCAGVDYSAPPRKDGDRALSVHTKAYMFHAYERQADVVPTALTREDWR